MSPDDQRFRTAAGLIADGGIISVQVLNEFANVAFTKLRMPGREVTAAITDFNEFLPNPRPITLATHHAAVLIAASEKFAFYDFVFIASALEAGCRQFFPRTCRMVGSSTAN